MASWNLSIRFCQTQITEDQLISVIVVISSTCNLSIKKSTTVHFSVKNLNKMKSNQSNLRHTTPQVGSPKLFLLSITTEKFALQHLELRSHFREPRANMQNFMPKAEFTLHEGFDSSSRTVSSFSVFFPSPFTLFRKRDAFFTLINRILHSLVLIDFNLVVFQTQRLKQHTEPGFVWIMFCLFSAPSHKSTV